MTFGFRAGHKKKTLDVDDADNTVTKEKTAAMVVGFPASPRD